MQAVSISETSVSFFFYQSSGRIKPEHGHVRNQAVCLSIRRSPGAFMNSAVWENFSLVIIFGVGSSLL
jgi:hypothetical protein